jgi:hypothetical protein
LVCANLLRRASVFFRLRKKFGNIDIAVCLWGNPDLSSMSEAAGADATVGSLQDAVDFCAATASSDLAGQAPLTTPVRLAV